MNPSKLNRTEAIVKSGSFKYFFKTNQDEPALHSDSKTYCFGNNFVTLVRDIMYYNGELWNSTKYIVKLIHLKSLEKMFALCVGGHGVATKIRK